ncbi:MAG: FAD-binding protein, partial [Pseudomonadales bacterium]|nr:FAD-binding protein [Pseudomonadales bacterium]
MFKQLINKIRFHDVYLENNITIDNPSDFQWDQQSELVIVGFGGAGASAALEASEQGLKTLVLDRLTGGGATNMSGGIYYAGGGTRIQQQAGVEDSSDNMFNYLKLEVQGAVSDGTLRQFCNDSVDNFNWLEDYGVKFGTTVCPIKMSFPTDEYYFYYSGNESFAPYSDVSKPAIRGHRGDHKGFSGPAIFQPLKAAIEKKPQVQVMNQTKVVALIKDSAGAVIGVKAIQIADRPLVSKLHQLSAVLPKYLKNIALFIPPLFNVFAMLAEQLELRFGKSLYIKADKGVVLATGGFFMNQNMVKKYAPDFVGGAPIGTFADDGSGIQMAVNMGAKTSYMDSIGAWRFINPPISLVKGLLVGPSGKRICNEMLYGAQLGDSMMREHQGKGWIILDDKTYRALGGDMNLKIAQWFHIFMGYLFKYVCHVKANSIADLARQLQIDEQSLTQTLNEYNVIAQSKDLDPKGKPKEYMTPINSGPFHAIDISYHSCFVPCPSITFGGLQVDRSITVLASLPKIIQIKTKLLVVGE